MIQNLLNEVISQIQTGLTGTDFSDPNANVLAGPIVSPAQNSRPRVAVYFDVLSINQKASEMSSSEPRPQPIEERLSANEVTPQGPYPLAKTPLQGSVLAILIFNEGELGERQQLLVKNKDYTIDYNEQEISFTVDMEAVSTIVLKYSFVGVFSIREFKQDFLVDVYESDLAKAEEWAAIASSIIFTNHNELLKAANEADPYIANQYVSTSTVTEIVLISGETIIPQGDAYFQLRFRVKGQLKSTRAIEGGFGIIEKIKSIGKDSEHPRRYRYQFRID